MARALLRARLRSGRSDPPVLHLQLREFEAAGRPIIGSAPVGADGTAAWLQSVGDTLGLAQDKVDGVKNAMIGACTGALSQMPIKGRITVSGYEGSELLVARLLVESGADVRYVGSACPRPNGRTQTANGSKQRASTSTSAPASKRTLQR